jgi:hypothetical protein
MNDNIRKYIYTFGAVFIVFLLGVVVFKILPILILAGIIVYAVVKFARFIKAKKKQKGSSKFDSNNRYKNENYYSAPTDDYTNGEIIDVDYEEINKK